MIAAVGALLLIPLQMPHALNCSSKRAIQCSAQYIWARKRVGWTIFVRLGTGIGWRSNLNTQGANRSRYGNHLLLVWLMLLLLPGRICAGLLHLLLQLLGVVMLVLLGGLLLLHVWRALLETVPLPLPWLLLARGLLHVALLCCILALRLLRSVPVLIARCLLISKETPL